jgi:hypothetical protein
MPKRTVRPMLFESEDQPPSSRLDRALKYYSRPDIQKALLSHAHGRRITVGRQFRASGQVLLRESDIIPLVLSLGKSPPYWPSLHGTIACYKPKGGPMMGCDFVVEVDFKKDWRLCFDMTRPVVRVLQDQGVPFCAKYSGNCSLHLIVPAGVFPEGFDWHSCHGTFQKMHQYIKRYITGPGHLDTSFNMPSHYLRLPYSLNENTGNVSLPLLQEQIGEFDPSWAKPEIVKVQPHWWRVPKNATDNVVSFMKRAVPGRFLIAMGLVAKRLPRHPGILNQAAYLDRVRKGLQSLEVWQSLIQDGEPTEMDRMVDGFLSYYGRQDVQYLMYRHTANRVVSVCQDLMLALVGEPPDIPALAAFAALEGGLWTVPYFNVTSTLYDSETGEPVSHDLVLKIVPSPELEDTPGAAIEPLVEIFSRLGVFHRLQFDGRGGMLVVLPADTLISKDGGIPGEAILTFPELMLAFARRVCGQEEGRCRVSLETFQWLPVAYSLDPDTGMASVPIEPAAAACWSPEAAQVEALRALPDWPDTPEDAAAAVARFYEEIAGV